MSNTLISAINNTLSTTAHVIDVLANPLAIGFLAGCTLGNLALKAGIL